MLFTGKGGVGKTSLACATAVHLAQSGQKTLLVSTDPASNVGQVFGVEIGNKIRPIPDAPGLDAIEINPQQAAAEYRERIIAPVRGLLPEQQIAEITEQLSGSCTTEIAAFNEFTSLLADPESTREYDHVVFDTAPTGHTIRLLQLPGDWTKFIDDGKGDVSCLGPLSGLEKNRVTYARAVAALGDSTRTAMVLVARPQASTLAEAARTSDELAALGIHTTRLVINAVLPQYAATDTLSVGIRAREQAVMEALPANLAGLPRDIINLKPVNTIGVRALENLLSDADDGSDTPWQVQSGDQVTWPGLETLIDQLAKSSHGLVMCVGKGGVGKTTVATAIAVALAGRGKDVHLSTTDPAGQADEMLAARTPGLQVSRIDPVQAVADYRAHVMATKGATLDDDGRAVLAEDLMSPCTEEIAVFEKFSSVVAESSDRIVVLDTAPTGHTVLLMDATGSYHREVTRHLADGQTLTTPLLRLQDAEITKIVIVTLPETTPVMESEDLVADLARAGIHPWAWVINQSLAVARPSSGLLAARAAAETPLIARVAEQAPRLAVIPMLADEPDPHCLTDTSIAVEKTRIPNTTSEAVPNP